MQRIEPVFYAPMIDSWIVTRYATVRAVLQDTARFSPRIVSDPLTPLCPFARDIIVNSEFDVPGLLVNNATPNHPHFRKFFGEPLQPNHLASLRPFIEQTFALQLARIIENGPGSDPAPGFTLDLPAFEFGSASWWVRVGH